MKNQTHTRLIFEEILSAERMKQWGFLAHAIANGLIDGELACEIMRRPNRCGIDFNAQPNWPKGHHAYEQRN